MLRSISRYARRVCVVIVLAMVLSVAAIPASNPSSGGFSLSVLWSWLGGGSAWALDLAGIDLPEPAEGRTPPEGVQVDADATRAGTGEGRAVEPEPGTLEPYRPHETPVTETQTGTSEGRFDPETSVRVPDQSTADTDLYSNADGSFTRRTFSQPVNFQAPDGAWQPIDSTLTEQPDGRLHVTANSIEVSLTGDTATTIEAPEPVEEPGPGPNTTDPGPATQTPATPTPTGPEMPGPAVQGPAVQGPAVQGPAVQGPRTPGSAVGEEPGAATAVPDGSAPVEPSPVDEPGATTAPEVDPAATVVEVEQPGAGTGGEGTAGPVEDLATLALPSGESLGFRLEGAAPVEPSVEGATAYYAGVLPDTDLELSSFATGIKETLVLHSPAAASEWIFPLTLNGLTPALTETGSIDLLNAAGEVAAHFPNGFMQDSNVDPASGAAAESPNVAFEIIEHPDGQALKVTADRAWLEDPARVYPVRVDPTAQTVTTADAQVDNDPGTLNDGDSMTVGTFNGGTTKARSFIKFGNISPATPGIGRVTGATLNLFLTWTSTCTTYRPFNVHEVTQDWTPAGLASATHPGPSVGAGVIGSLTVTNHYPACTNTGAVRSVGSYVSVPINAGVVDNWARGGANYGVALLASETDSASWKRFTSSNYAGGGYAPYMDVTYTSNTPPQIGMRYPANNGEVGTLTPNLAADGVDPDLWPGTGVTYNYVVYDGTGTNVVANSGWTPATSWPVPSGALKWNEDYLWVVQAYDQHLYSPVYAVQRFSTAVPQPVLTGDLGRNPGRGFEPTTGNYTTTATDASIPTVGPPLEITRSYNSLDVRRDGAFGAGWSSVLDTRATQVRDSTGAVVVVQVTHANGKDVVFGRNADGSFTAPQGTHAVLTEILSGSTVTGYRLVDKDSTEYEFTQPGPTDVFRLTSTSDANDRALEISYDGAGNANLISSASGRELHLNWSHPTGSTVSHVTQVSTGPAVPGDWNTTDVWQYSYGDADQLLEVCAPLTPATCWNYDNRWVSQHANALLNEGPTGFWRLNEPVGTPTAESSVLANAGTDRAIYTDVALEQDPAMLSSDSTSAGFNGTSSRVELPQRLVVEGQYQSVSMWFRTTTPGGVLFGYSQDPITRPGGAPSSYIPALYIGSDGKLRGQFWNYTVNPITTSGSVTDGEWHQVVLTGAGTTQTLYLDGQEVGTLAGGMINQIADDSAHVYVGAGYVGGVWPGHANTGAAPAPATFFNGDISDVAFFNRPVPGYTVGDLWDIGTNGHPVLEKITRPSGGVNAEVGYSTVTGRVETLTDENGGVWTLGDPEVYGSSEVYTASMLGGAPSNYWRLAETGTTQAVNEVRGTDATYNNVTLGAAGPFSGTTSAAFNGSSSYLTLPDSDMPGPDSGSEGISVGLSFKMASGSTAGGVLYGYQNDPVTAMSGGDWIPALYIGTDGKLRGGFGWNQVVTPGSVNDGQWHHVVLTHSAGVHRLYLDGQLVGSANETLADIGSGHSYVGTGRWEGSWSAHGAGQAGYFPGSIAEVAHYRSELPATQVTAQFQAALQTVPLAYTMHAGVATQTTMPVAKVTVTGPGGAQTSITSDLIKGRQVAETDALGNTTHFGYDTGGNRSMVYDPRGVLTQRLHDVRGNTTQLITCQDQAAQKCNSTYYTYYPDATSTSLTPDARNDLMLTMRDGRSASSTDDTYRTSYDYDANGNRTTVTDPLGRATVTAYTDGTTVPAYDSGLAPPGLPMTLTTPGGAVQQVRYLHSGDVAEITDPAGKIIRFTYDGLGRQTGQTEITDTYPAGLTSTTEYDGLGRIIARTGPGVTNRVTGAVHTEKISITYDADGHVLEQLTEDLTGGDADRVTANSYNALGQQISSTNALSETTWFEYDDLGRIFKEIEPDGRVIVNLYDLADRLTLSKIDGFVGDPNDPDPAADLITVTKDYDPAGRLAAEHDAMGWTTNYTYTDDGRPATTTRTDGTTSFVLEDNSYDAAGNLTRRVTNDGATVRTAVYDAAGRQVSGTLDPDGLDRTTSLTYNLDDQVVSTVDTGPGGALAARTDAQYDPLGRVVSTTRHLSDDSVTPTGWWRMSETSGSTAADAAGNAKATASGPGVGWSTDRGGSATFDGDDYLETSTPALDTARSFTVSAWVKRDVSGRSLNALAQDGAYASAFFLGYDNGANRWAISMPDTDTPSYSEVNARSTGAAALNTWTRLTGVYDADAQTLSLYVDGTLQQTVARPATGWSARGPLSIGRGMWNTYKVDPWSGGLDDVLTVQRALTGTEVAALHADTVPATDAGVIRTSRILDRDGLPVSQTDPNGNTTYLDHDEAGRLSTVTSPATAVVRADTPPANTSAVSFIGYNTFGEVTDREDPNGNWSLTEYDAAGRITTERSPGYTAPGAGTEEFAEWTRTYTAAGLLATLTDPLGDTTTYAYDQLGNLSSTTAPDTGVTRNSYDLLGNQLSVTDPTGAVQTATYDLLGRPLTSTEVVRQTSTAHTTTYSYGTGGWLEGITSPEGVTTSATYNAAGETVSVTDGAGNTSTTDYDAAGRPTRDTLPDGSYSRSFYDLAGRMGGHGTYNAADTILTWESQRFDKAGNVRVAYDRRGTQHDYDYNARNELTWQREPTGTTNIETTFDYDAAGNATRLLDGRGNEFWTTYNSWNLTESRIEPATAAHPDAEDRTWTTTYDLAGQAVTQTAPDGVTTTSVFDEMGRLTQQSGSGAEATTDDRTFTYDDAGRMTGFTGGAGAATVAYDDRGLPTAITGIPGTSAYAYDGDGRLTTRTDAAGQTDYTYDTGGRQATATNPAIGAQTYTYNQLSQVEQIAYGTGNRRTLDYDDSHRLTSDALATNGGTPIASVTYGWDPDDNLTSKTTTGTTGAAANTYTYDDADRLTSWDDGTTTTDYTYDASGNRLTNGTHTFTYDARNRLLTADSQLYTYTPRGTLLTANGQTTGTDAFGQVITQQHSGGTQTYDYDGLGRVIQTGFSYTGLGNDLAGDGTTTYPRGPGGNVLGATTGGTGRLAWTDLHSDVIAQFTSASASLSGSITYDPLGSVTAATGMTGTLGYQSEYTDNLTGRVNMASRWYNTATGQFDTRDTANNPANPASINANRYQYGNANPLTGMDPTGRATCYTDTGRGRVAVWCPDSTPAPTVGQWPPSWTGNFRPSPAPAPGPNWGAIAAQLTGLARGVANQVTTSFNNVASSARAAAARPASAPRAATRAPARAPAPSRGVNVRGGVAVAVDAARQQNRVAIEPVAPRAQVSLEALLAASDAPRNVGAWDVRDNLADAATSASTITPGIQCLTTTSGGGLLNCMVGGLRAIDAAQQAATGDLRPTSTGVVTPTAARMTDNGVCTPQSILFGTGCQQGEIGINVPAPQTCPISFSSTGNLGGLCRGGSNGADELIDSLRGGTGTPGAPDLGSHRTGRYDDPIRITTNRSAASSESDEDEDSVESDSVDADGVVYPYALKRTESLQGNASRKFIEGLVEKLRRGETLAPVELVEITGELYVIDGHHRVVAAKKAGVDVPYRIISVDDEAVRARYPGGGEEIVQTWAEVGPDRISNPHKRPRGLGYR
ncbi:LamG-like jellyroll fold domain-containing protein [Pseudonocardia oroxyli]|uniref:RHS repeat-associated core domain-containing protein n=1 Tax=Pseudonocardia oroxyli TaxID=366584 RepID=A0A1G8EDA2_PSEOR|nr:LamG-like jellyroll fold domain-containing protein [Pseudonocardia oroxyli]SDH67851.1 RHS repeat-associated core domain-containing protein [Pseudonocardia oroxyli]